ncbi:hypothetical protein [Agromyces sp. Root81]|uniref:hypothetical protein n=1 Tax=Agromyces sp. Root81 TaxID=1736601 RepID=UPI0012F88BDB|nr:hypothetical protein [Agromyces sp. Root81]
MSVREAEPEQQRTSRPKVVALAAVSVVAAIGIAGWLVMSGTNVFTLGQPKMWTAEGLEAFVDDVDEEFGTTEVVEAYLSESYATVEVPVDGDASRTITYKYDGGFTESRKGTRSAEESTGLIDLREFDAVQTMALLPDAPEMVGLADGAVSAIMIRLAYGPDSVVADVPEVSVHVETEFGETGSVRADLAGNVVSIDTD